MAASAQDMRKPSNLYKPGHRVTEFRIPMPLSVEEFRRSQLYTIAKSSRDATQDTTQDSAIECLINEPYNDPKLGGEGQYTFKVYHLSSRLPSTLRKILPKSAMRLEEKAWNAYPYLKTELTCPFFEKASIVIESMHAEDTGETENILNLSKEVLAKRKVEVLDICDDDIIDPKDYKESEDPKLFQSAKTGRGKLQKGWQKTATPKMCAYKLVSVTFDYTGLQKKVETTVFEAQRKVFAMSHRQAFSWIDEWVDLTIEMIREIEKEMFAQMNAAVHTSKAAAVGLSSGPAEPLALPAGDGKDEEEEDDK